MKNLKHLDLPPSSDIGVGFNGGPGCGNVYFGKEGRKYRRQITRESHEATEKGGNIVLATLPHFSSFTIGGSQPTITRGEDGKVHATWPWTGKMDEEPEEPDFEDIEYDSM